MSSPKITKESPIGIFDSGVGGLTVARSIIDQLPGESILYVGDSARGPYGPRPLAEVRTFSLEILDQLVDAGCKALVIACNTASAAMLRDARERYAIPVVEVIQPAARRAVSASRTGNIGVIGTNATIESGAYLDAFAAAPQLQITSIACPLLTEFVAVKLAAIKLPSNCTLPVDIILPSTVNPPIKCAEFIVISLPGIV